MQFFETKVSYSRESEDGKKMKKVTDTYLVEAVTFGDAEARTLETAQPFVIGGEGLEMKSIKIVKYNDILPDESGHYWFKAKISYISIDSEGELSAPKEKKVVENLLVQAVNLEGAYKAVQTMMKDAIVDYTIVSLQETAILDVIRL